MKNYVIGTLAVIILVLASVMYKNEKLPRSRFPVAAENKSGETESEVHLYLYVFFSKNNCIDCFEVIGVLNNLPPHFRVFGVVPEDQLKEEKELRRITTATFPLLSPAKYKKHIPWCTPTIIGVSPKGNIVFILPGVPGEKEYLQDFLESLYTKLYPTFLKEKLSQ